MIDTRPMFSLNYNEFIDHRGDINGVYELFVRTTVNATLIKLYDTFSEGYAKIAFNKLKNYWDSYLKYWLVNEHLPVMFEINSQVYKTEFLSINQSCITGSIIPGNQRYGEFNPEPQKYDYIQSTIFFYEEGTCLVKGNQLFLNGDLLYNSSQLKELCDKIGQEFNKLDSHPYTLIDYLNKEYKCVKDYICNDYCSFNIKGDD